MHIEERIVESRSFNSVIFREIVLVASWAIWTHRNEVIFYGVPLSLRRWKKLFQEEFSLVIYRAKPSLKPVLQSWLCNFLSDDL